MGFIYYTTPAYFHDNMISILYFVLLLHLYIIKTLKSENYFFYFTLLPVMNIYVNFFNKIVLSVSQTKIHMYLKMPNNNLTLMLNIISQCDGKHIVTLSIKTILNVLIYTGRYHILLESL
jgi:hypothetical protein